MPWDLNLSCFLHNQLSKKKRVPSRISPNFPFDNFPSPQTVTAIKSVGGSVPNSAPAWTSVCRPAGRLWAMKSRKRIQMETIVNSFWPKPVPNLNRTVSTGLTLLLRCVCVCVDHFLFLNPVSPPAEKKGWWRWWSVPLCVALVLMVVGSEEYWLLISCVSVCANGNGTCLANRKIMKLRI